VGFRVAVRPGTGIGRLVVRVMVPAKPRTLVTLMIDCALWPAGIVRLDGVEKRKNEGAVT